PTRVPVFATLLSSGFAFASLTSGESAPSLPPAPAGAPVAVVDPVLPSVPEPPDPHPASTTRPSSRQPRRTSVDERRMRSPSTVPAPRFNASVRRQVLVPLTEHAEAAPEALLGALFVEAFVDVGDVEGVDGGGEGLDVALAPFDRSGEGHLEAIEDAQARLAHHDDDLRLDDRDLLDQAGDALLRG